MEVVLVVRLILLVVHPTPRHLDGLGPLGVHASAGFLGDVGVEGSTVGTVHVLEIGKVSPHVDGEGGGNCGTESGGFVHCGALDGDLNDIGLGLVASER